MEYQVNFQLLPTLKFRPDGFWVTQHGIAAYDWVKWAFFWILVNFMPSKKETERKYMFLLIMEAANLLFFERNGSCKSDSKFKQPIQCDWNPQVQWKILGRWWDFWIEAHGPWAFIVSDEQRALLKSCLPLCTYYFHFHEPIVLASLRVLTESIKKFVLQPIFILLSAL